MAVDEAIMTSVAAGTSPPTLRLYAWTPACLSIGYGQSWTDADAGALQQRGWHIVRRPTGGRAILHIDELTYSLSLPQDHPLAAGRIVESYRRISAGLLAGLNHLGIRTRAEKQADDVRTEGPVCFVTPSHYEITTRDGRKLIGSAQTRRRGVVLQHGSLPLSGDIARICDALAYPSPSARLIARGQVRARAATLADALDGTLVDWQTAADALVLGFMQAFGAEFIEGHLSSEEQAHADELASSVYGDPAHLQRL